jgi:3-deoxy-7-phosphoheptulonate synthase
VTHPLLRNLNIVSHQLLPTPQQVREEVPLSDRAAQTVADVRQAIVNILSGSDPRLLLVVGPCSIHDPKAAREYAQRLKGLAAEVKDVFLTVMRVYFEKPRTAVGWKGFINDPFLDDSFRIDEGLRLARKLLLEITEMGVPVGTEALDPITPQYLDELVSWTAIGARTVESQTHREMASGLSTPIGFKNGTDGSIQTAINALKAVSQSHHFLGISSEGQCSVFHTAGNKHAHIVLRGGAQPNYDSVSIALCEKALQAAGLAPNIMVDCSHGNSMRNPELQPLVLHDCVNQILEGNRSIKGLMLESNLLGGNQPFRPSLSELEYGVSITDACIDWGATEAVLRKAHASLAPALAKPRT